MSSVLDQIKNQREERGEDRVRIKPKVNGLYNDADENNTSYLTDGIASFLLEGPLKAVDNAERLLQEHVITTGYLQLQNKEGEFDLDIITPSEVKANNYEMLDTRKMPTIYKPKTTVGNLTTAVSQFITGFIGANKYLKGLGLGNTILKRGIRGTAAGAVSDFTVFDPHEGNLSNALVEFDNPVLNNRVTKYLAIDEDDSDLEARLKLTLEGMMLGSTLEIMIGLRAMKKARKAKTVEEKEKIIKEEGGDVIQDLITGGRSKKSRRKIAELNRDIDVDAAENIVVKKNTTHEDVESLFESLFNTSSFTAKGALRSIDDVLELFTKEELGLMRDGVLTDKAAKAIAKQLGENPEDVIKGMGKTTKETENLPIKILAAKAILQRLGLQIDKVATTHNMNYTSKGINKGKGYETSSAELNKLANVIKHVSFNLKKQIKAAAQATQKGNVEIGASNKIVDTKKLDNIIDDLDGNIDALAKSIAESKTVDDVLNTVHKGAYLRAAQSLFINSLLSSYWTQGVNLLSNAYQAVGMPSARILGGLATGNKESVRLGFSQFQGMVMNSKGMWGAIKKAAAQGDPILDTKIQTQDYLEVGAKSKASPISGEALSLDGAAGTVADWFGVFTQLPSRALITGDEFFKQLNYRGSVYANAINLAQKRNLDLGSKQGKKFIQDILDDAFEANGTANVRNAKKHQNLYIESLEVARENTFQLELKGNDARFAYQLPVIGRFFSKESKSMGENIETLLHGMPGLRFVMPFVRTPTNLWRQAVEYTPLLGRYSKRMDELYRSGPQGRADVIGRQMVGTAMVLTGYSYLNDYEEVAIVKGKSIYLPKMTGAGPKDFKTRNLWRSFGWQPYSILVNSGTKEKPKWVYRQYNRMDPRFFHRGILADINEVSKFNPEYETFSVDMAGALMISIMKNIGDKSYTKGIGDLIKVMDDPSEQALDLFLGKTVSNFTPYTTFVKQFKLEAKDYRTFSDRIFDSLHIADLEPKRDFLGKPITRAETTVYVNESLISSLIQAPFLIGKESQLDPTDWKMQIMALTVNGKISLTPPRQYMFRKQIDLAAYTLKNSEGKDQTALDFYRETIGTTTRNGATLEQALKEIVETRRFKRAKVGTEDAKGKKEDLIQDIYDKYKKDAFKKTKKKYKDLATDIKNVKKETRLFNRSSGKVEETTPGAKGSTIDKLIVY